MNPFFSKIILVIAFFNLVFCSTTSLAKQKENRKISENMKSIIKSHALIVSRWVKSPVIINSVIEQNNKNISLQEIKAIDKEWIEGKQNEFAKSLQQNQVGQQLEAAVETSSAYVEAILCDNKGAIVGTFPKTTDYWQGDEDKFIQSYNNGSGKVYFGPLAFDESTQAYSVQISIPVNNLNNTIGVLIVGIKSIENEAD